jgi:hypothetical protein
MRDMNEDLLKHPFEDELKAIGRLIAPELRLPVKLYDMERHYKGGEGQMDRLPRRSF